MYQRVFYWFAGKRLAQTGEEGYDCGDRGWLSKEEIRDISDLLWDRQADDCILFHQFSSMATQTFIRPEELLQLRRRNTWLSESSDYNAKFGPIKLMEILSKGKNKKSKTSRLLSWVVRNRELDHMCPWFWSAAKLMHDYQRMLPEKEDGCYGTMTEVFRDKPKGGCVADSAILVCCIKAHADNSGGCCSCDAQKSSHKPLDRDDREQGERVLHATFDVRQETCCSGGERAHEERFPLQQPSGVQQADPPPCVWQARHHPKDEGVRNPGAACLCYVPPVTPGR